MFVAHKIEIRPNTSQETYLRQACGVRRFVYNSCLDKIKQDFSEGRKWTRKSLQTYVQELRRQFPWIGDVTSRAAYNAVEDLIVAMKRFFRKVSRFPRFKRKGISDGFAHRHRSEFSISNRRLKIARLPNTLRMRERLRFDGTVKSLAIKRIANKWFAVVLVEMESPPKSESNLTREPSVGVDFGVSAMAALSTGEKFSENQPLRQLLAKLMRLGRQLSRKMPRSKRREEAKRRLAMLHYKIACQRQSALHSISNLLTRRFDLITIEDLNVRGMVKNRCLSRAISDAGFGELRRQLTYKSAWRGCELVIADRFFASTRTCPQCGEKRDMPLSVRMLVCSCGYSGDRDVTAAINLERYGRDRSGRVQKRTQESSQTLGHARSIGVDGVNTTEGVSDVY